jgi:hypothetical protein
MSEQTHASYGAAPPAAMVSIQHGSSSPPLTEGSYLIRPGAEESPADSRLRHVLLAVAFTSLVISIPAIVYGNYIGGGLLLTSSFISLLLGILWHGGCLLPSQRPSLRAAVATLALALALDAVALTFSGIIVSVVAVFNRALQLNPTAPPPDQLPPPLRELSLEALHHLFGFFIFSLVVTIALAVVHFVLLLRFVRNLRYVAQT